MFFGCSIQTITNDTGKVFDYLAIQGDSLESSMEMAVECLAGHLYSFRADGEKTPAPSNLANIDPVAVSKEVSPDKPVGEAFVNIVSVDVDTPILNIFLFKITTLIVSIFAL